MSPAIASIVEGHGEVSSVPELLRRIFEKFEAYEFSALKPVRNHRQRVVKPGELEKALGLIERTRPRATGILILLDADDECPAELHDELLSRARRATTLPVAVVFAKQDFENWFLGCKEAFQGFMGIPEDAEAPENPEAGNGKRLLKANMQRTKYDEVVDQVRFVAKMDLDLCQERCPSLAKLMRDVKRLVDSAKRR